MGSTSVIDSVRVIWESAGGYNQQLGGVGAFHKNVKLRITTRALLISTASLCLHTSDSDSKARADDLVDQALHQASFGTEFCDTPDNFHAGDLWLDKLWDASSRNFNPRKWSYGRDTQVGWGAKKNTVPSFFGQGLEWKSKIPLEWNEKSRWMDSPVKLSLK